MRADISFRLAYGSLRAIRANPLFPFKTGNLKWNATYATAGENRFAIVFDTTIAPYIPYLDKGVEPQIYFRKDGMPVFTNGSVKHRGFIRWAATNDVIEYLAKQFHAQNEAYKVVNNQGKEYIHKW